MSAARLLALPLCAALMLGAGCKARTGSSVAADERDQENIRLTTLVQGLEKENGDLKAQIAVKDAALKTGGGPTVGQELGGQLGTEGLGDGFTSAGNGRIALDDDFAFAKGSSTLKDEGEKAIAKLALKLNDGDHGNKLVVVEGHTDSTPVSRQSSIEKFGDNWGLSAARAASVVRALQKAGIKAERLRGSFRGQSAPRATGGDKEDQAKNRRVEIYLAQ